MLYWIFDLDYTLYDIDKTIVFDYNNIKHNDIYLNLLLSLLSEKKLIFTNSNRSHCNLCLDIMNIKHIFSNIVTKDENYMKPNIKSYINFIKINNITKQDRCIFFEDNEINLKSAKLFGWTTVFIGKTSSKDYIDFKFTTIYEALEFFAIN